MSESELVPPPVIDGSGRMPVYDYNASSLSCVSHETQERLEAFAGAVRKWNRCVNLISRHDIPTLWPRHIDDALQLAPLLPANLSEAIDLGSGAGFPGLVLAIVTGAQFHLIEADQRKAAFLRHAARITCAPVVVHAGRIEDTHLPAVSLITARALASLDVLLEHSAGKLADGGKCLFPKGCGFENELTKASEVWGMRTERFTSRTDPNAVILRLSEIVRVRTLR